MRMFRFILATLLLVTIPFGVNAEEKFIKSDFKVRKNISVFGSDDKGSQPVNANKSFAEWQVFDFGDEGTTILLNFRIESFECGEDGKPVIVEQTYFWSSKSMWLGYQSQENGDETYAAVYGNQPCAALLGNKVDGEKVWSLMLIAETPKGVCFMTENI